MTKLKLDENLSIHLKPVLANAGFDVMTAADEGLLSQSDERISHAARSENRVLLTLDLEFANLRKHPPGRHPGIVLFRPKTFGPRAVSRFVLEFFKNNSMEDLVGCTVVVDPSRVRIRCPQPDTDPS